MVKKFLFSTILTTIVAFSVVANSEEVSKVNNTSTAVATDNKTTQKKKPTKVAHHSKKVKHDDAYSPKHHHKDIKQSEEIVVFAESKSHVQENVKHDSSINHDGLSVKVGGKVDIQYGVVDQQDDFKQPAKNDTLPQVEKDKPAIAMPKLGSEFANQNAMVSNGELNFSAVKDNFDGNKYGLEITANANTSPSASGNTNFASKVYMFLENNAGRFELGANDGASEAMAISAASIAKATGGVDGDASSWVSYGAVSTANAVIQDAFLIAPSLPYASQHAKKANKLTYYTPTYNGFKAGFSFVQDVTVQGTLYEALSFKGSGYKNVLEGGISYENKMNDVTLGLSATGQIGEARNAYVDDTIPKKIELKRLAAWQVGGKVSFNSFTVAGSYGDWGNSGTIKTPADGTPSKKANYWTAGLAYDYKDQGGISLTYMNSQRRGAFSMAAYDYVRINQPAFDKGTNKFESLSLGAEYKMMPGFMPYAEVTTFNYKTDLTNVKTNKGTVVLGGVKLNF